MTTASSGSLSQMKVTTQPSHAGVDRMVQSSQLMVIEVMADIVPGGCDSHRAAEPVQRSAVDVGCGPVMTDGTGGSGGVPRAPGYGEGMVHAFVLIDGEAGRVADLAVELAGIEGVSEVYSVAGHADIVAVVRVRHHEELADVVTRRISRLQGISDTRTLIAFQAYSRRDLDAIWDLGAGSGYE